MICENNNPLNIDCCGGIKKVYLSPVKDEADSLIDFKKIAECPHIMEIKTGVNYKGGFISYPQCKLCDAFEINI